MGDIWTFLVPSDRGSNKYFLQLFLQFFLKKIKIDEILLKRFNGFVMLSIKYMLVKPKLKKKKKKLAITSQKVKNNDYK